MQRDHIHRLTFPAIIAVALLAILIPAMVLAQDADTESAGPILLAIGGPGCEAHAAETGQQPGQPHISINGLELCVETGSSDGFTVEAVDLTAGREYSIELSVTSDRNGLIGFDSSCVEASKAYGFTATSSSVTQSVTLYGCDAAISMLSASVKEDGNTLDTTQGYPVVVLPPPNANEGASGRSSHVPQPTVLVNNAALADITLTRGSTKSLTFSLSNLTGIRNGAMTFESSSTGVFGFVASTGPGCQPRAKPLEWDKKTSHTGSVVVRACGLGTATLWMQLHQFIVDPETTPGFPGGVWLYEFDVTVTAPPPPPTSPPSTPTPTPTLPPPPPKPPVPKDLRANGHRVDGKINLRFNPVSTANTTGYSIRFVLENCTSAGICTRHKTPQGLYDWKTATDVEWSDLTIDSKAVKNAKFGAVDDLADGKLYRVEVQAINRSVGSGWSEHIYVYPTASNITEKRVQIATMNLASYQDGGEFTYKLCNPPPPSSPPPTGPGMSIRPVPVPEDTTPMAPSTAERLATAAEVWETGVRWDDGSGNNIIKVTYDDAETTVCYNPELPGTVLPHNQVVFYDWLSLDLMCSTDRAIACWNNDTGSDRTQSYENATIAIHRYPSLRSTKPDRWFTTRGSSSCVYLHYVMAHEVGHAFGLGHNFHSRTDEKKAKVNKEALMHPGLASGVAICDPSIYDTVAMMANYQSR